MWRKDRLEADVKRVGRGKVAEDLFGSKTDTKINFYYGEKANMNPSLATIEKFCRYFHRPVSYYVDISIDDDMTVCDSTDDLRTLLRTQQQLISSQEAQIALLKEKLRS